jgi:dienelactone hydrolase
VAICFATPSQAYELVKIKASQSAGARNGYLTAELFKPPGTGPFPAVVLMHGCGGWQPAVLEALHAHATYLLDRGYVVLNLDSFGTRGKSGGAVCASLPALYRALDYRTSDAFDALRYLKSRDFVDAENAFLMGQSNGGSVAINAAKLSGPGGYRAVAAYYPWCGSLGGRRVNLKAPLIIFSGGKDDWVPAWQCRNKHAVGAELRVIEYRNAAHSFDLRIERQRYLGKLIGHDKTAYEDSRAKMVAFFDGHRMAKPAAPLVAETEEAPETTQSVTVQQVSWYAAFDWMGGMSP